MQPQRYSVLLNCMPYCSPKQPCLHVPQVMLKLWCSKHHIVDNNPSVSFYVYSGKFVVRDFLDGCNLSHCHSTILKWIPLRRIQNKKESLQPGIDWLFKAFIQHAKLILQKIGCVGDLHSLLSGDFPLQRVFKNKTVSVIFVCGPTCAGTCASIISMSGLIVFKIPCGSQSSADRNSDRGQFWWAYKQ